MESKGKFTKNKQNHLIQYKWNKWFLDGFEGLVNWSSDCEVLVVLLFFFSLWSLLKSKGACSLSSHLECSLVKFIAQISFHVGISPHPGAIMDTKSSRFSNYYSFSFFTRSGLSIIKERSTQISTSFQWT